MHSDTQMGASDNQGEMKASTNGYRHPPIPCTRLSHSYAHLNFLDLAKQSTQALDGDGLHVVAVVVELLQHGRADAPLHRGVDLRMDVLWLRKGREGGREGGGWVCRDGWDATQKNGVHQSPPQRVASGGWYLIPTPGG